MNKTPYWMTLATATVVTLVSAVPRVLFACAVCYGAPEAP
jgi:hypothetical protein